MNTSEHSFDTIVSEHYEVLYRFALSLTRSPSDAYDLTQQTFYVWATKGHQLRDGSKVKTWLFTTMHRVFLAERRRQVHFPQANLEDVSDELPFISPERFHEPSEVLDGLAQVDEVYQVALALCYLDDLSYKDIAVILEVPVGTVKSRIARGITQLKEVMSEYSYAPTPLNDESANEAFVPVPGWNRTRPRSGAPGCARWSRSRGILSENSVQLC